MNSCLQSGLSSRISLFLPSLVGGGAERVVLNLSAALAARGYPVDLVLQRAEGLYLSQVPDKVRLVDLRTSRMIYALLPLRSYLQREKPCALLSAMPHSNVTALLAEKLARTNTRIVISEHNTSSQVLQNEVMLRERLAALAAKRWYPKADSIVAVSEGVANDLAVTLGLSREKIQVIYNPVIGPELLSMARERLDHPWFLAGAPPVLLGVGRLTRQKDFHTLIRSFAQVRKQLKARLLILGEGEDRQSLNALIHDLDISEDVQMPGQVTNPYKYMANAAVFVLSSRWEGLPTVLIEAMACGASVIASDCPSGPREILENGKHGMLFEPGDERALRNAVIKAVSDEPLGRCNPATLARFSIDTVVELYLAELIGS